MRQCPESDPRYHKANITRMLEELIQDSGDDVSKVTDPKARALFETTAEVLTGLKTAYQHLDQNQPA